MNALAYTVIPQAKYFQFEKQVTISGSSKSIRIDFLSAPPEIKDLEKVKVSNPRIKPKGVEEFHAFDDRKDDGGEKSDKGRHHAWDVFTTITGMNEADWENAKAHKIARNMKTYLESAAKIQIELFNDKEQMGFIRMRESASYQRDKTTYDGALDNVVEDLKDLFK